LWPTAALQNSWQSSQTVDSTKGEQMAQQNPLHFVFYFAVPPQRAWEGFVSLETNRIIFMGGELETDLQPGSAISWAGTDADGNRITYVRGEVLQSEPTKLLQYTFSMGSSDKISRVTIELLPESEATKVSVTHDNWAADDVAYASCADGWPRILSRLKTLLETGKTFNPH
jgi:uncharacterized protein YndB with AHSA1/START domain